LSRLYILVVRKSVQWFLGVVFLVGPLAGSSAGQASPKVPAPDASMSAKQALDLADKGECREALPALRKALPRVVDKDIKFQVAMASARCGMSLGRADAAVEAIVFLNHEFPHDPRVLYITTHYYSELANRAAQELAATAPSSIEAQELDAEAYEAQGKWDEAAAEYNRILVTNPETPSIHYRLGRIFLSKPQTDSSVEDAKKEFEAELKINPHDAPSEFMLGDVARQAQQWPDAIQHFSQAAKLDAGFSEAYLGLGIAFNASEKYSDAIAPLETYVKMEPADGAGHYQLALAYGRTGRRDDAARQMALQREAEKAQKGRPQP
jgi:tetratricopeptide (TPR) repeat protein